MHKGGLGHVVFLLFLIMLAYAGYFYFFELSPTFVSKPQLEKPAVIEQAEAEIEFRHFAYLLNEIGAYKLHEDPFTKEPAIVGLYVDDTGQELYAKINDGSIIETKDTGIDLRISVGKDAIFEILEGDIGQGISDRVAEGTIRLEIISDEKTLALKGFKSIYDSLSKTAITGEIIGNLYPTSFIRSIEIVVFLIFALTLAMILEKELN